MGVKNLECMFAPRSIALIGATERHGSVGQSLLQNLVAAKDHVQIFPVNPKHQTLANLSCYPSVSALPEAVDLAVICTPAATVPGLVRDCGERGIRAILIITAGFRELGAAGRELENQIRLEARKFDGLRILGPNCLGFIAPHLGLNVSFVNQMPARGSVAFVSQSGALCSSVLDWAIQNNIGFSHFVSFGNALDIGVADLIDYLSADSHTQSTILYVESISDAARFMSAARAFTRDKPIVAYKAGRFAESAKAAASHTGAMAGVDDVYEAAFSRAGIVRVYELDDLFECAEILARQRLPHGERLAIVTNAGGPGVIATDGLLARRGALAKLSEATVARLNQDLPPWWSHGNPIDILGDATPDRFRKAVSATLADEGVDGLLAILSPQAMSDPYGSAQAIIEASGHSSKPVLAAWMGGERVAPGIALLRQAGIPTYSNPDQAVRAFSHLVTYERRRQMLYETPYEVELVFNVDSVKRRAAFDSLPEGANTLSEAASKEVLAAYGIPISRTLIARTLPEAVACATQTGYPVVFKLLSPDITHKSDVGGVVLNILNESQAEHAYEQIIRSARERRPDARLEGVTVQPMVVQAHAHELIVGVKRDPIFGAVLMVGAGGVAAEINQDRALELPPLNERLARRMLESLRFWPLLKGYRGKPAANIDKLVEVLMRLSYLAADNPNILELDINPLLATPSEIIALDARIVLDREAVAHPPPAYSHLAIRPYPSEYQRVAKLKTGEEITLRPILPKDEPLWLEMLARCSPETIYQRFRYMFKATTHEMAARFCFLDYDRELAIVAERECEGVRQLIGVGRLVANPDHTQAEYAVLVIDEWQNRGVGSLLTDYCIEIGRRWGLVRIVAEMAADNQRMAALFRDRDFKISSLSNDTLKVVKEI